MVRLKHNSYQTTSGIIGVGRVLGRRGTILIVEENDYTIEIGSLLG